MPERLFDRPPPEAGLWMQVWADTFLTQLESVPAISEALSDAIEEAQDAADLAIAAAASADEAADAVTSEQSIVTSFVLEGSFAGASPLEADSSGNVTVKAHTRRYGNTTLNPDVLIASGVVATGGVPTDTVWIFYDDATRADTSPTFLFSASQPVQGGDTHVIGQVEIPPAGTSDGGYVRPPGFTGATP